MKYSEKLNVGCFEKWGSKIEKVGSYVKINRKLPMSLCKCFYSAIIFLLINGFFFFFGIFFYVVSTYGVYS